MKPLGLLFLLGLVMVSWCGPIGETERVVIFHTNDLHGMIDPLPRIAHLIEQEKGRGENVYYLNAGDAFTGNPIVDQFDPSGQPILDLFRVVGLTASAFGNHEFDYGQGVLGEHMKNSGIPFLCANVDVSTGLIPAPRSHLNLITKKGIRLIVVGLLQIAGPDRIPDTHPDHVTGLRFLDPFTVARSWAQKKQPEDILVFLTHLGFEADVRLAQSVPGIDLIIGGHSHTEVAAPQEWNGTLIVQAGSKGRFLGRIDLHLSESRLIKKTAQLIDLNLVQAEHSATKAMVARFNDNPRLNRILCDASVALEGYDEVGSLFTDAIRSELRLDVVFLNQGGIRVNRLPPAIRLLDVYRLDPFSNDVVEFRMLPGEIRSLIRDSIERTGGIDLQVAGATYLVRQTKNRIDEIVLMDQDGRQWPEDRPLRVGLNSYMASSYHFEHTDPGRSLQTRTSDCLIRFLEKRPNLSQYKGIRRVRLESRGNDW